MNPAIDKSSAVAQCRGRMENFGAILLCMSREGEELMFLGPFINLVAIPWLSTRQAGCQGRCWEACWMGRD